MMNIYHQILLGTPSEMLNHELDAQEAELSRALHAVQLERQLRRERNSEDPFHQALRKFAMHSTFWHQALQGDKNWMRCNLRFNHVSDMQHDLHEAYDCSCLSTLSVRGVGPVVHLGDGHDE